MRGNLANVEGRATPMQVAILAFIFGMLLFLMSAAGFALEPASLWSHIAGLAFLALALLHAGSGFLLNGGGPAHADGRHTATVVCAAISGLSTTIAALIAYRLAALCQIAMSAPTAILVVVAALAGGAAITGLALHLARKQPIES